MDFVKFLDSKEYKVVHIFSDSRVLIDYDGLFVFADKFLDAFGEYWDLSGVPADLEEKIVLNDLLKDLNDQSQLNVIKNDD